MLHPDLIEDRINSDGGTAKRRKLKIYMDEAKARHTTHWDLDYMTTAEIDALMMPRKPSQSGKLSEKVSHRAWSQQGLDLALLVLALGSGLWLGFLLY